MDTTTPRRHGCLTGVLVWMLVINSLALATYVLAKSTVAAQHPKTPSWFPYLLAVGCAVSITLTIAVFRWKKWAFYGLCVAAGATFLVNVWTGVPIYEAAFGLFGPAILYGVLLIGKERTGWTQLK
jgi:hypothetical protein